MLSLRKWTSHVIVHLILASLCSVAFANDLKVNIHEKEIAVLDRILQNGKYDARIRPAGVNGTYGAVVVRVSMYVRTTPSIDDAKQEFSVQLIFREQWIDERLQFDDMGGKLKYLSLKSAERIWMPDVFFAKISTSTTCLYQTYGFTAADVVFLWRESDPVQVRKGSKKQGFTMIGFQPGYCNTKSTALEYSCLKADFSFVRGLMPSLIRIYIPICVLVLASFVSFWLDPDSVAARVVLGAATLLATVFQISNGVASLPAVSYIKAVDIWMGVCLTFIFGTLVEFATLNYSSRYYAKRKCEQAEGDHLLIHDENKESMMKAGTSHYTNLITRLSKFSRSKKKIDVIARITFPISFALFNLAYWIAYLSREE